MLSANPAQNTARKINKKRVWRHSYGKSRLCLVCNTVTSTDLSEIHRIECSACLTQSQSLAAVKALNISKGIRSLRVCSDCVTQHSLCIEVVSTNCVYMRCSICKQNQKQQKQLPPSSFALKLIVCDVCRQYMRMKTGAAMACSSCVAQHSLCCGDSISLHASHQIQSSCKHAVCKICQCNARYAYHSMKHCKSCNSVFCADICGRDKQCANCLWEKQETPAIAWLDFHMYSYNRDIKQLVLQYLRSLVICCAWCASEVEVGSFEQLVALGTDTNGDHVLFYFVDARYKKNLVFNSHFTRHQRYAVVYCARCTTEECSSIVCEAPECNNERVRGGLYCFNHPMCSLPNCTSMFDTKIQMQVNWGGYGRLQSLCCSQCDFAMCSDCRERYEDSQRYGRIPRVPPLINAETGLCSSCCTQRRDAVLLTLLESALSAFDAAHVKTIANVLFEFYNGYMVKCSQLRCGNSVFLNSDDVEQKKTANPYPPNSTYFYGVSKKIIRASKTQHNACEYSYIDFLDVYVCAYCVECTTHMMQRQQRASQVQQERMERWNWSEYTGRYPPYEMMFETQLNQSYEFDHEFDKYKRIPRNENHGKKSSIKRCRNRIKRKAHFQRKADKKQNIVARNKWNKRYLVSAIGTLE